MAKLGSYGAAVREFEPDSERDTFEFFGDTFTVEGVIPSMLTLQLGAALAGKLSALDSNACIFEALRAALTRPERDGKPEDDSQFDRFYRLAVRRKCDLDDLVSIVWAVIGAQSGKADEEPPTSPPGSPHDSTSSNSSASDSPDSPRLRPVDEVLAG